MTDRETIPDAKQGADAVAGTDTIAAISTPPGRGGIGIVRLSGPWATEIAAQLVSLRQPLEHGRHGWRMCWKRGGKRLDAHRRGAGDVVRRA